jgi:peptidoglycan/LPS O-acetylase OafA/YrhL
MRADVRRRATFRADIQGLRGLAIVLVLAFHAFPRAATGGFVGVDVFFVISGFLITGLLVDEWERSGGISLVGFYGRRAKRLLPVAALVLGSSIVLTFLFLPKVRWIDTGWDVVASGLYVVNWRLAGRASDYLAADQAPSIVQHYWSLSVEEQFYLLWPVLLIAVGAWVARRQGRNLRRSLLICLALVGLPSLVWSAQLTQVTPPAAFYVTTTRIWELALGGGLAILGPDLSRFTPWVASLIGWVGLAGILVAGLTMGETGFPGLRALVPTVAAAAVIAGGFRAGRAGPLNVLALRPMLALGAWSYSLYLWHWPLLVAAETRFGELGPVATFAVVFVAGVLSALTYRFVEDPIRSAKVLTWNPKLAIRLGLACTAFSVLAGFVFRSTVVLPSPMPAAATDTAAAAVEPGVPPLPPGVLGAMALGPDPADDPAGVAVDHVATIYPDPMVAYNDLPSVYRNGCYQEALDLKPCTFGSSDARFTVAIAGDSHAAQWVPAVEFIAAANNWRLLTYARPGCAFVSPELTGPGIDEACQHWNAQAYAALTGPHHPDLLLTSAASRAFSTDRSDFVHAMHQVWSDVVAAGVALAVLRDTPGPGIDIVACASAHREQLTRCAVPRDTAVTARFHDLRLVQDDAAIGLRLTFLDLTDAICPGDPCAAVIGGVLVYRDSHHLTASYALSLAPRLRAAIEKLVK